MTLCYSPHYINLSSTSQRESVPRNRSEWQTTTLWRTDKCSYRRNRGLTCRVGYNSRHRGLEGVCSGNETERDENKALFLVIFLLLLCLLYATMFGCQLGLLFAYFRCIWPGKSSPSLNMFLTWMRLSACHCIGNILDWQKFNWSNISFQKRGTHSQVDKYCCLVYELDQETNTAGQVILNHSVVTAPVKLQIILTSRSYL